MSEELTECLDYLTKRNAAMSDAVKKQLCEEIVTKRKENLIEQCSDKLKTDESMKKDCCSEHSIRTRMKKLGKSLKDYFS